MTEKEERILIARSTDYTLTDTDKGELFEGKIAPHCANVFTRQEAIERMAKEIARQYDPRKPKKEEYEKVWKQELFPATKKYYLKQAECVLNALLEGK